MRIVSWNCRANFAAQKANGLMETECKDADILVIQECQRKWDVDNILEGKVKEGRWYGDIQERNEGVGVFILTEKYKFTCFPETFPKYTSEFRFFLPFKIKDTERNEEFTLFAVWLKDYYKQTLVKALNHYKTIESPAIIIGDFNLGNIDKDIDEAMRQNQLFNCAKEKASTHTCYGSGAPQINDFCYATENYWEAATMCIIDRKEVKYKDLEPSDHCPIVVDFAL
jgi:exonuclease III